MCINEMSKQELLEHRATIDETLADKDKILAEVSNSLTCISDMLVQGYGALALALDDVSCNQLTRMSDTLARIPKALAEIDELRINATADKSDLEYMRHKILVKLEHPALHVVIETRHFKRTANEARTFH